MKGDLLKEIYLDEIQGNKLKDKFVTYKKTKSEGWVEGYMRKYNFLSIALPCFDILKPFNGLYILKKEIKSIRVERRQTKKMETNEINYISDADPRHT